MYPNFHKLTRTVAALTASVGVAALAVAPAQATVLSSDAGAVPSAVGSHTRPTQQPRTFLQYGHSPDTNGTPAASQPTFLSYAHSADTGDVVASQPSYLSYAHAPDTNDPALFETPQVVAVSSTDAFDWSAFGIGIGSALTAMLLLAAGVRIARQTQGRLRNA